MEMKAFGKINNTAVLVDALILIVCFVLSILAVNPVGDFPLNDDWSYAITVKRLLEIGLYVPNGWGAMSLLTHIGWGWLFCAPFGFSFNALRLSTLTASLAGGLSVYFFAKELDQPRLYRIIAALTLIFNPIYFALSNTFMTDVLFSSLQLISALFLARCLRRDTWLNLLLGTAAAVAATLSRQLGIAAPIAFAITYLLLNGISLRALIRALLPMLISIGSLAFYQHWLAATGRMNAQYAAHNANILAALQNPLILILTEIVNAYIAALYYGLFLAPILLLIVPAIWRRHTQKYINVWLAIILFGVATFLFSYFFGEPRLPMLGNILGNFGIGPLTLKDTYILGRAIPRLPSVFWLFATCVALLGATLLFLAFMLLVKNVFSGLRSRRLTVESGTAFFLLISAAAYLVPLFTSQLFDRYLIPAVALIMLGVMSLCSGDKVVAAPPFRYASIASIIVFAIFSIGTTRDYLMWNRVRWQALNDLTQAQHIDAEKIDGGFEFNGFYLYDRNYRGRPNKSWWWVEDDDYLIGFQSVPGYTAVKEYSYFHWLPPYEGKIIVSKKTGL
jgi:hypothetical protein